MEKQITSYIDNALFVEATDILEKIGLDINIAIKMMLKSIIREQNITFLLSDVSANQNKLTMQEISFKDDYESNAKGDMTKSKAVLLFRNAGITFNKNITFASKNRTSYNYWANPEFYMLKQDWFLILNDWVKQDLYLFVVPKDAISASELIPRNDRPEKVDLQILYNDSNFYDVRSDYSFAKYLVKQIKY